MSPLIRVRILRSPPVTRIDGIRLDWFEVGKEYELGTTIASLFLAEGWAEPVDAPESRNSTNPDTSDVAPRNLIRETTRRTS